MIHQQSTRVLAADLADHVGETIELSGWVHRVRELKSVSFLIIRDRSGLAQVVISPLSDPPAEESVVRIRGPVVGNQQAPGGAELVEPEIELLSAAIQPAPFDLYRPAITATLPTILDHAPLSLRHRRLAAIHTLAAAAVAGFREVLDQEGFTEIHTPKITGSATESGANVFRLDWFGRPAYLAQSPQFFKQMMVGVFERVYETGPVFRAEPHDTARHLAQYTSLDAEFGFIHDHQDVMIMVREVIAGMVAAVAQRSAAIAECDVDLPAVPSVIPQLHFADAVALLGKDQAVDLAPADERELGAWAMQEHGSDFLFVAGYPMAKRPFYTHPEPGRPTYSNSFDLLFRGLELITGGQRLHRYRDYLDALGARGEPTEPYAGYLSAFAGGMPPHGGFALGLERFVARLIGAENVRMTTLFPRDLHRLAP